jgi:hypothetical protein
MVMLLLLCLIGCLLLTNPYLISAPVSEITRQVNVLRSLSTEAIDVRSNWSVFYSFIARQFSGSSLGAEASPVAVWISLTIWGLASGMYIIGGTRETRWIRLFSFAFLLGAGLLMLLIPVYRSTSLYHRYFLNGTGVLVALPILGLSVVAHGQSRVWRTVVGALVCAALAAVAVRADSLLHSAHAAKSSLAPHTGLDLRHSRNQAVQYLIDHHAVSDVTSKVLVDQHGYFDLAALRAAGLEPVFINCLTFSDVLRALPDGRYAILSVSGDYEIEPRWAGIWDPPLRAQYDAYLKSIAALPRLYLAGTSRMKLLYWGPSAAEDIVTVSVITVAHGTYP